MLDIRHFKFKYLIPVSTALIMLCLLLITKRNDSINLTVNIGIFTTILLTGENYFFFFLHKKINSKNNKIITEAETKYKNLLDSLKQSDIILKNNTNIIKTVLEMMTKQNSLTEDISDKMSDVATVAQETSNNVTNGAATLTTNIQKLLEIKTANNHNIDGIKNLSRKIESIWDLVTLIMNIADQAKIIAFNAELEASSAGESGKNFHIVATEIRRLANNIIDGTKEIKDQITDIQKSSNELILLSENGTNKVKEGCETAEQLEDRFNKMRSASEVSSESTLDISNIIKKQLTSSEQTLITLKQVVAQIEEYSQTMKNIITTA